MGMIERKKAILLNEPHLETTSGSIASFQTDMKSKLKECKLYFSPVQSGSGDPSPTNVRPIAGFNGITVYHSGSDRTTPLEIPILWSDLGTKYGGYVDLVSGELVIDHSILTIDGTANWKVVSTNKFYYEDIGADVFDYQESIGELSNLYPYSGTAQSGSNKVTINKSFYLQHSPASTVQDTWYNRVWVYDTDYTFSTFKDMLNSTALQVTYKMRYSQTYQLTPQTIKTLIGRNNIWSDAGDVEVTYWTH